MRKVSEADFASQKTEMDKVLHGPVGKKDHSEKKSEFLWAMDHMAKKLAGEVKGSFDFNRYSNDPVKDELSRIFHGKCAYCESYYSKTQPVDVEHFRPKNDVRYAGGHGGYWWLAMEWDNLLPSCIYCNRVNGHAFQIDPADTQKLSRLIHKKYKQTNAGKGNFFPILNEPNRAIFDWDREVGGPLGPEGALLLHPVFDAPSDHLEYMVFDSFSVVAPKILADGTYSPKGVCSIAIYGLNRLALVQARTKLLRTLELLLDISVKATEAKTVLTEEFINVDDKGLNDADRGKLRSIENTLSAIDDSVRKRFVEMAAPEAEYSAMVLSWIEQLD